MSGSGDAPARAPLTLTRVYLALTRSELVDLSSGGSLGASRPAHAVTDALRTAWPDGDDEQWEYAALMAAASDSRDRPVGSGSRRRLVVAADLPAREVSSADAPTAVHTTADLRWRQVSAILVDPEEGVDDEEDLAWFATQEVADLLASWT